MLNANKETFLGFMKDMGWAFLSLIITLSALAGFIVWLAKVIW